jgi:hypothetical protein
MEIFVCVPPVDAILLAGCHFDYQFQLAISSKSSFQPVQELLLSNMHFTGNFYGFCFKYNQA